MAPRSTLSQWEQKLEQRWRRKRLIRRCALVLLILLLIFWMWPRSCTPAPSEPSQEVKPEPSVPSPPSLASTPQYLRPSLGSATPRSIVWGGELTEKIRKTSGLLQGCFPEADTVAWFFLYNPGTGELQHQKFLGRDDQPLAEERERCLLERLPKRISLKIAQPSAWFSMQLNLLAPAMGNGDVFQPPP